MLTRLKVTAILENESSEEDALPTDAWFQGRYFWIFNVSDALELCLSKISPADQIPTVKQYINAISSRI